MFTFMLCIQQRRQKQIKVEGSYWIIKSKIAVDCSIRVVTVILVRSRIFLKTANKLHFEDYMFVLAHAQ